LWKTIDSKTLSFTPYRKGQAQIKRVIEQNAVGTKRIAGLGLIAVPPGGVFPPHTHPEREEVYYVLAGSGSILVEDKVIQAEEGLTFYVSGETRHGMKNLGSERLLVLYVTAYV
jgi:quercetin dioxygenase-like cupin family protein